MKILKNTFLVVSFAIKGSLVLILGTIALTIGVRWEDVAEQAHRFLF